MSQPAVATRIREKLQSALKLEVLDLVNESSQHAGYFDGKESHFKLTLVSADFAGKRLAARHQAVYAAVADELTSGGGLVHALAIHAYTPDEWQSQQIAPASPNCAGANV